MAVHLVLPQRVTRANLVEVSNEATGWTAEKMWSGRKNTYCRSTADNASWYAWWDSGAAETFAVDTLCIAGNFTTLRFLMDDSALFADPPVNMSISLVSETITSYSASGPICTRTDATTWTPNELRGKRAKFATSGAVHVIVGNDTTRFWTATSMTGSSGNLQILPGRVWAQLPALSLYRYMYVNIYPATQTAEDYYAIGLLAGRRIELPSAHMIDIDHVVDAQDYADASGGVHRATIASARQEWQLNMAGVSRDLYDQTATALANLGRSPMGLIPDSTNANHWATVLPDPGISWRAKATRFNLIETL